MSDAMIIALITAGCFVLWLFLHRRKPVLAPRNKTTADAPDNGWFSPLAEEDAAHDAHIGGDTRGRFAFQGGRLRPYKPEPTESVDRDYTFIASVALSPAWHNENGWPAMAMEYFPFSGSINAESIRLTAIVRALYEGMDLPDKEISETVPNPPEVLLRSLHASGHDRIKATFEIGAGIAERARKDIPVGYNQSPKSVSVDIRMELTGKSSS